MTARVAINGLGRIGRATLRALLAELTAMVRHALAMVGQPAPAR